MLLQRTLFYSSLCFLKCGTCIAWNTPQHSMLYINHIFFIQSITDGHWSWLVGSMTLTYEYCCYECTSAGVFFKIMISFPLSIYQVMGLLGQMVVLSLVIWKIIILFSTKVKLIYIPTNCTSFLSSTSMPTSIVFDLLIVAILTDVRRCLIVV